MTEPDVGSALTAALAGRYAVERKIGQGGMATVFAATDLAHDRRVAIKVLRAEFLGPLGAERFLREIALTAQLDHPHIVPLFDSGRAGDLLYYAMPFVEGESLRDRLRRAGALPVEEAVLLAREVADALDYAHQRGIVHRDIKPENILLSAGHARVADFGIAKAVTVTGEQQLTEAGTSLGTILYMSPEQSAGDPVDQRSDVYSLAAVLYEMLTGEPPYAGPSIHAVLARQIKDPVPRVSALRDIVPPGVEAAVTRGLAKLPADRFPSARAFAAALGSGDSGPFPVASRPAAGRWRLAVAALVLLGAAGAAWWAGRSSTPARPEVQRLAVMPLENRTGQPELDYLVAGIHDALMTALAESRALQVIARSSVMRFADPSRNLKEIGEALNVDVVVEGSVVAAGDSLLVLLQAVDPASDVQQVSLSIPVTVGSAVASQAGIARTLLQGLGAGASLTGGPARPAGSSDSVAQEAYLRGRFLLSRGSPADLSTAVQLFEQAIQRDSGFAEPYSWLATLHINSVFLNAVPPHLAFDRAKTLARRALALDDRLPGAHTQLGFALALYDWDWAGAEAEFTKALELDPSSEFGHMAYGYFLTIMGRHDEAITHARQAVALDPVSLIALNGLATQQLFAKRLDEAEATLQRILGMDSNFILALDRLCDLEEVRGRATEAVAACSKASALYPPDQVRRGRLAGALAVAGRRAEAEAILRELIAQEKVGYVPPVIIARVHASLGNREETIEWLEKGFLSRDSEMSLARLWPGWGPVRNDPRFREIVARMKFPG